MVPQVPAGQATYDLGTVLLIFPLIVIVGANVTPNRLTAWCRRSGEISSPLYVLQTGIMPSCTATCIYPRDLKRQLILWRCCFAWAYAGSL
jgi:hypothetical protein